MVIKGVTTPASAIVLKNICKKQYRTDAIPSGRDRSTTSNSFPNLVRSCPLGVAEKKESGARNTDFSIFSCRVFEAFTPTLIVRKLRKYMETETMPAARTSLFRYLALTAAEITPPLPASVHRATTNCWKNWLPFATKYDASAAAMSIGLLTVLKYVRYVLLGTAPVDTESSMDSCFSFCGGEATMGSSSTGSIDCGTTCSASSDGSCFSAFLQSGSAWQSAIVTFSLVEESCGT
mmetsp:Transcript_27797/g.57985  ORF Transcript_27797/g.57985 Transcript_27797/m.57985 type:complete len:235 (+) Transcript_27797:1453-2157(+)